MQPTRRPGTLSERLFLTRVAISDPSVPRGRSHESCERRFVRNPKVPGRHPKAPTAPGEVAGVSVCAAAQKPTQTSSDTPLSPIQSPRRLEPPRRLTRPSPSSDLPHERLRPLERPEVPSTARKPPGELYPNDRHLFAARRRLPRWSRLFHEPELPTLTGRHPLARGDSVPSAGKQPIPIGVTRSAPDCFSELVAR